MTNQEFSDTFTTMLNSFNSQARFGEQASAREIVLDEYEKSVFLTQAQDIVVKSYFDGTLNAQGQGFDDSTRRQMDFSSLIKVAELTPITYLNDAKTFDDRGLLYKLPCLSDAPKTCSVLFILNELMILKEVQSVTYGYYDADGQPTTQGSAVYKMADTITYKTTSTLIPGNNKYVIVPISFKEYDREMSKPYSQPLKKQAWRLLQHEGSGGYDVLTELIPRHDISLPDPLEANKLAAIYKLRYIERPTPIILVDLPDGLEIDGETEACECSLNPIIHMDILNKAVELAIATRAGGTQYQSREEAK